MTEKVLDFEIIDHSNEWSRSILIRPYHNRWTEVGVVQRSSYNNPPVYEAPGVYWPSIGSVTASNAKLFLDVLIYAIEIACEWDKDTGKELHK